MTSPDKKEWGIGTRIAEGKITGPIPGPCICEWAWSAKVTAPGSNGMYLKSPNPLCLVRHAVPQAVPAVQG